jgi:SulP family sulfate permease
VQEQLAESGALKTIGGANLFDTKTEAIETIYRRLDPEVCKTCRARIFRECQRGDAAREPAARSDMRVAHA